MFSLFSILALSVTLSVFPFDFSELVGEWLNTLLRIVLIVGIVGSGIGAVVGGIALGIAETMSAGYLSSAYKDAIAFVIILVVLFFMPSGLFGKSGGERV